MAVNIQLKKGEKAYFISDLHLGLYPYDKSAERERLIVKWMDSVKPDAKVLFLLGDVFDFWYEYRKVIPKGFTRFLGKLAELADSGVEIHYFTGNHDVWAFGYLSKEIGLTIYRKDTPFEINGKKFIIGHGDELGLNDYGYKFLKAVFKSKILQFLFSRLHPNLALTIGHTWSKHSRLSKGVSEAFLGENKEHQILFAKDYLKTNSVDYFVYGHRHIPMDFKLSEKSRLINLGEWIHSNTYAIFDGESMELMKY
jgi:UDP-2,3-diacylglucosamine hydrolase